MDDLSERLFTHFVAGRWRVPFGRTQIPVRQADGATLGSLVLADARDIARACRVMRGADTAARARLRDALAAEFPALAAGFDAPPVSAERFILVAGDRRPAELGAALLRGTGAGMIWSPPPEAASLAVRIAALVQAADLPPGAFALLPAYMPQTAPLLRATGLPLRGGAYM